jgi:hypothetical protein
LCLITIKRNKQKERIFISLGKEKNKERIKKEKAAIIEANDTYLKMKKIIIHIQRDKTMTSHKLGKIRLKPIIAPKLVATPFPPLNLKKIVQLCPTMQKTAARTKRYSEESGKKNLKMLGEINPFKKSRINTKIPHFLPTTRKTLVAPILPEPNFLMSIFFMR